MKCASIFFLILAFQIGLANDITLKISDISDELKENANHVIIEESYTTEVLSLRKVKKTRHSMVAVLDDDSDYTEYAVFFGKFVDIKSLKLTVYDAEGKKLDTHKQKDFSDYPSLANELYTDDRYLFIDLERYKTPYILEIEQETEHKDDLIYADFISQNYSESVIHSEYKITYPQDQPFKYNAANGAPEPEIVEIDGIVTLTWTFEQLLALEYEASGPSTKDYFPYVSLRPTDFFYDGYGGSMKTWDSYNDFYFDLNKDRAMLSSNMKALVRDRTANAESTIQKIDTLYDYLKENMRYVSVQLGIGGWQTFDAEYVEHNKFGDCKALSNFMGAMLTEAGIENYKVLIHRGVSGYQELSEDFVNTPFNHAMVYVPGEDLFLECTSNNYPVGYLGVDNSNKKVMISTIDGPIFKRTPHLDQDKNRTETISEVILKDNGEATVETIAKYSNGAHDGMRNAMYRITTDELEKGFQKSYSLPIQKLHYLNVNVHENEPVLDLKYKVAISSFASKAGKRMFIPVNPLYDRVLVPEQVKDRKLPFLYLNEETIENQIIVNVPDGYEIESMPNENYEKETAFGNFRLAISKEGNQIKVYKKWVRKKFDFPADQYSDYRSTLKEFAKVEGGKIVLIEKKT